MELMPLPYAQYDWTIGKLGKDFYDTKFGDKTFSANKIKELMTEQEKSNFNAVLTYQVNEPHPASLPLLGRGIEPTTKLAGLTGLVSPPTRGRTEEGVIGYAICYQNPEILHYCYPFYTLQPTAYNLPPNTGLGMMLKAIVWAKEQKKKYVYLGSFQRPTDTYKLQFEGLEWWNGRGWQKNIADLKTILTN